MSLRDRMKLAWRAFHAAPRRRPVRGAAFPAADMGRLSANWTIDPGAINRWLRHELRPLRARSRQLARADAYAKKFVNSCVDNIAGAQPFQLQAKARFLNGRLHTTANEAIELAWTDRSKPGNLEVTGRLSMSEMHRLIIRCIARDGEVLLRRYRGNEFGAGRLQLIDIDRLDEDKNEIFAGGGSIKMGVELDTYAKPVAYHILRQHPGELGYWNRATARDTERVAARDVVHLFVSDWPEQVRGFPWMHAAMVRLYHLGAFEEAAVINARIGASKIATLQTPDGDIPGAIATGQDSAGNMLTDIEPGQYWTLPPGVSIGEFAPDFPDAAIEPFIRSCLRGVAAALGVAYHSLANDPSSVNYSTARVALLEERDMWMALQSWYVEHFCQPDFEQWLSGAILSGTLPETYFDHRNQMRWQPKRWAWVDPKSDASAKELMLNNKLTSHTRIAAELGEDFEEILLEIEQDQLLATAHNVALTAPAPKKPAPNEPTETDETQEPANT